MTTQTKPSAGAIRLAKELFFRAHDMAACVKLDAAGRYSEPKEENVLFVAEIIDRESGLTEALDALRGMIGLVQLIQSTESPAQKHLVMSNHRFIEAQRVIAKAENPNAETVQAFPRGRWTEKGTV